MSNTVQKETRIKVSEEEKARRKMLGLPVTKELRYMKRHFHQYEEIKVTDYEIVNEYSPSGTYLLEIYLENGSKIRILSPFFAEMQKSSFEQDMKEPATKGDEE